jgi:hypothetical protein
MQKFDSRVYVRELTFDESIEYNGIIFTPVKTQDYNEFYTFIHCMLQDKNSIPDIDIIKMSYLDYLFYLSKNEETSYMLAMLVSLICLCTNVELEEVKYFINQKNEHVLILNGIEFDKNKFMHMRGIICAQNDVDISIFELDPRVRQEILKTMELKNKSGGFEMATLEEQIICILISSNISLEQIKELSLRKFKKILNRIDHKMHYEIYTLGSLSGNIVLKQEIPHWLATLEKSKFDQHISSYEDVQNKVKMSNMGI